ncbi:MAG: hypothetical protein NT056_04435 [Proteobacteria bacterium]|nr:hypothetical protein [Pseudomonadota bacterium]
MFGWARHNLITQIIMENPPVWVKEFSQVKVNKSIYEINSLNPKFNLIYTIPEKSKCPSLPSEFVSYARNPDRKYGFQGAPMGATISALQILADFSDEPDWDMDIDVETGQVVDFMGGSQGYRHMYYPAGTFHIPNPFMPQGKAPERAELFYEYAREAFSQGDYYWGFRFLARAIHYLEDLANPFHTVQLSTKFIMKEDFFQGTIQNTKNYHFAYEDYVAFLMVQAQRNKKGQARLLKSINQALAKKMENIRVAAQDLAGFSNREGAALLDLSFDFFGEEFRSNQKLYLNAGKIKKMDRRPEKERALAITEKMLAEMSSVVKGFLDMAGKELVPGTDSSD